MPPRENSNAYSSELFYKAEQLWRSPLLGILLLPEAHGGKQRALSFSSSSPPAPLLINRGLGATRGESGSGTMA